jgi:hypothetical protein
MRHQARPARTKARRTPALRPHRVLWYPRGDGRGRDLPPWVEEEVRRGWRELRFRRSLFRRYRRLMSAAGLLATVLAALLALMPE